MGYAVPIEEVGSHSSRFSRGASGGCWLTIIFIGATFGECGPSSVDPVVTHRNVSEAGAGEYRVRQPSLAIERIELCWAQASVGTGTGTVGLKVS